MRTIAISWDSLAKLSYKEENREELLVWVLINAGLDAQRGFMEDEMIYSSLESLWDLVTFGGNDLNKQKQRPLLVKALIALHKKGLVKIMTDVELEKIKFTTKLKIKINYTQNKPYTCIRRDEIGAIFNMNFTDISLGLCAFFSIVSHGGKHYYYQDLNILAKNFSHEHYFEFDNIESWLIGMTNEDLKDMKNIIYYPKKEDIIIKRYSNDEKQEVWTTRPTLDKILKKLHDIGVLSEIETNGGMFGNKIIFCKAQHEKLVRVYYDRVTSQNEYTSSKNNTKITNEPKPTKKPEQKRSRKRAWESKTETELDQKLGKVSVTVDYD